MKVETKHTIFAWVTNWLALTYALTLFMTFLQFWYDDVGPAANHPAMFISCAVVIAAWSLAWVFKHYFKPFEPTTITGLLWEIFRREKPYLLMLLVLCHALQLFGSLPFAFLSPETPSWWGQVAAGVAVALLVLEISVATLLWVWTRREQREEESAEAERAPMKT